MKTWLALPLVLVLAGTGTASLRTFVQLRQERGLFVVQDLSLGHHQGGLEDERFDGPADQEPPSTSSCPRRGSPEVEEGQPADLAIAYQAGVDQEKQFYAFDTGWGYGPGWGGGWYGGGGGGMTTGRPRRSTSGSWRSTSTRSPKTLVWRGVVSKTLDTNAKPDKQQKNLAKSVAKLLKNYPPP